VVGVHDAIKDDLEVAVGERRVGFVDGAEALAFDANEGWFSDGEVEGLDAFFRFDGGDEIPKGWRKGACGHVVTKFSSRVLPQKRKCSRQWYGEEGF